MKLTYDSEVDILCLWLAEGPWESVVNDMVLPGVLLTSDQHKRPLAFELWEASKLAPLDQLKSLPSPGQGLNPVSINYLSLAEAAKRCGLSAGTLKLQAQAGKLDAVKIGRNWAVREDALSHYMRVHARKRER